MVIKYFIITMASKQILARNHRNQILARNLGNHILARNHGKQILVRNHGNQILAQVLLGFLAGGLCSILRLVDVVSSTGESCFSEFIHFFASSSYIMFYNEFTLRAYCLLACLLACLIH